MDSKQKKRIIIIVIIGALIILSAWLYIQWLAGQPSPETPHLPQPIL